MARNVDSLRIVSVLCTGDLVEQNDLAVPDGVNGDQTSREQWQAASRAFARLDGKVPYVICSGNHDYGYQSSEVRRTHLPEYFRPERNACWRQTLVAVGNNYAGEPRWKMPPMSSARLTGGPFWWYHWSLRRVTRPSAGPERDSASAV